MTGTRPTAILVALDIDGTLVLPGTMQIPNMVRVAVARVLADGRHHVVLASGRSLAGVLPIARRLGLTDGWVVASNGGVTARLDCQAIGGYVLEDVESFDPAPVVRLARAMFPGIRIAAERVGWGYDVTHVFGPGEVNGAQQIVSPDELQGRPTTRLILQGPGVEHLLSSVRAADVTATPARPGWVDITASGLSKATALEKVRANLGVDPTRTVAVGDGENDLEMLAWAAHGVAMGHAPAVVREAADAVTGTLDEHGAAAVLDAHCTGAMP